MSSSDQRYSRKQRSTGLSYRTKLSQGLGAIPNTIKNWVFNTFTLLFYNQILGIDAVLVSIALAVAIVIDAISDPLVASYSDNLSTRWGRRHPLMLFSSLPLGAAMFGIFSPPDSLSPEGLLIWLLFFTILVRSLMTLFFVPWAAIAAELSDDYDERTSLMSFRFGVGWIVGVSFPFVVFTYLMPGTEMQPVGQLNAKGYPIMASFAGILMTCGALLTTLLTVREIPFLRKHTAKQKSFRPSRTISDIKLSLENPHFSLVFVVVLLSSAITGTIVSLNVYMWTYFWELTTADLRWFPIAAIGAVGVLPLIGKFQKRWDKKEILLTCSIVSLIEGLLIINFRFLEILPENGTTGLLVTLVGVGIFSAAIAVTQGVLGASVIADILDEQELRTGLRQEAMFNAALSFCGKAVSGIGLILGGLIINLIGLPAGIDPAEVPAETVKKLGVFVGVILPLFYLIPIALWRRYEITREVHANIQRSLALERQR